MAGRPVFGVTEWISGSIFIRPKAVFELGRCDPCHEHDHDHTAVFFGGRWQIRRWRKIVRADGTPALDAGGQEQWLLIDDFEQDGPFHLLVEPRDRHEFTYLGCPIPQWMEEYVSQLPPDAAASFRARHNRQVSTRWCVYSHKTPQGEWSQVYTGWPGAYQ